MSRLILACFLVMVCSDSISAQWTQIPGRGTHWCLALYAGNDVLIAGTQDSNIMRSTDQGMTWHHSSDGIQDSLYTHVLYGDEGAIYIGSNKGAYRSGDRGVSWQRVDAGPANPTEVATFYRYGNYLYMGSDSGVFRSSDQGQTWGRSNTGIPSKTGIHSFASEGAFLYAGTARRGVFQSSDGGEHWEARNAGMFPNITIGALWAGDGYIVAFIEGGGWYRSTDRGSTWDAKLTNLTPGGGEGYCVLPLEHVIICGTDDGAARSDDYGATWKELRIESPTRSRTKALSIAGSELYAGALDQWIWRRPLSEILPPSSVAGATPHLLNLSPSAPNPASTMTFITYSLPVSGPITLTLYNAMMEEIRTLADGYQEAGEHHVMLDVHDLPSGMYYYRLNAAGETATQRLVIVK